MFLSAKQTETRQLVLENAIPELGPHLYNSLPNYLRDISVKIDKIQSDIKNFLELIPNEPKIRNRHCGKNQQHP